MIIPSSIIPPKGFKAINLFGIIFVRKERKDDLTTIDLNHEAIHTAQMKELLYVFFYLLYVLEWLYRLLVSPRTAYRGLSFEKEAYDNQNNLSYLKHRKHFAQWRNLKKGSC